MLGRKMLKIVSSNIEQKWRVKKSSNFNRKTKTPQNSYSLAAVLQVLIIYKTFVTASPS